MLRNEASVAICRGHWLIISVSQFYLSHWVENQGTRVHSQVSLLPQSPCGILDSLSSMNSASWNFSVTSWSWHHYSGCSSSRLPWQDTGLLSGVRKPPASHWTVRPGPRTMRTRHSHPLSAICWLSHPRVWDCTARTALLCLSSKQNEHRSWTGQIFPQTSEVAVQRPRLNLFIKRSTSVYLHGHEFWALRAGSVGHCDWFTGPGSHFKPGCIVEGGILRQRPLSSRDWADWKGAHAQRNGAIGRGWQPCHQCPVNFSRSCKWWQGGWN